MNLGKFIESERTKQGLSRYRLAQISGVTLKAISYWETGERNISIDCADKVFNALGVTIRIGKESDIREDAE